MNDPHFFKIVADREVVTELSVGRCKGASFRLALLYFCWFERTTWRALLSNKHRWAVFWSISWWLFSDQYWSKNKLVLCTDNLFRTLCSASFPLLCSSPCVLSISTSICTLQCPVRPNKVQGYCTQRIIYLDMSPPPGVLCDTVVWDLSSAQKWVQMPLK